MRSQPAVRPPTGVLAADADRLAVADQRVVEDLGRTRSPTVADEPPRLGRTCDFGETDEGSFEDLCLVVLRVARGPSEERTGPRSIHRRDEVGNKVGGATVGRGDPGHALRCRV